MLTEIENGVLQMQRTNSLQQGGIDDYIIVGTSQSDSIQIEPPAEEEGFVVIVQFGRILLHRRGCIAMARKRNDTDITVVFQVANEAKVWLSATRHPWQNCRACGGGKGYKY